MKAPGFLSRFLFAKRVQPLAIAILLCCVAFSMGPKRASAQAVSYTGVQTVVASGLNYPGGQAFDAAGNLYVASAGGNNVIEVPASGAPQFVFASGFNTPNSLRVDAAGDVFVADYSNHRVVLVPPGGGTPVTVPITLPSANPPSPTDLTFDSLGNLYVVDSANAQVILIPMGGGAQSTVGTGFFNPAYVAIDASDNLYISDDNPNGASRIIEVPTRGGPQSTVATFGSSATLGGVAIDKLGNLYATDINRNSIYVVPTNGGAQTIIQGNAAGVGFSGASGLTLDAAGNLYIADAFNNRVVKYQANVDFGGSPVGVATASKPLGFVIDSAVTIGQVKIVTQGNSGLDFVDAGGSSCVAGAYAAGASCTVNVAFDPLAPGLRAGAVLIYDNATPTPNVLATAYVHGNGVGSLVAFANPPEAILGPGANSNGSTLQVDAAGNIYQTSQDPITSLATIVRIPAGGGPSTVVYTAPASYFGYLYFALDGAGDFYVIGVFGSQPVLKVPVGGGAATPVGTLTFDGVQGLAVDGASNLYVADAQNNRVVELPADGTAPVNIGTGLSNPTVVAVDAAGDVYIGDYNNYRVVLVPANGGPQTTVATGFGGIYDIAVDPAGNLYVADGNRPQVEEFSPSGVQIATFGANQPYPDALALDSAGNIYYVGSSEIVEVQRSLSLPLTFASQPVGTVSTPQSVEVQNVGNAPLTSIAPGVNTGANYAQAAGSGTPEDCTSSFSLSPGASCNVSIAFAPTVTGPIAGTAVLSDNAFNLNPATQAIQLTGAGSIGSQTITFNPISTQTVGNTISLSASASSALPVTYISQTPAVCSVSGSTATLLTAGNCTIEATQTGNANYSSASPVYQNFAVSQLSTSAALTIGPAASVTAGTQVTFKAIVSPSTSGSINATGTVVFMNGATVLGSGMLSGGVATFSTSTLAVASYSVTANYSGDANFTGSVSAPSPLSVTAKVPQPTTTSLQVSPNPAIRGQNVTLMATVASTSGVIPNSGDVYFYDGVIKIGQASVVAGKASLAISTLTAGIHLITAVYEGTPTHAASASSVVALVVKQKTCPPRFNPPCGSYRQHLHVAITDTTKDAVIYYTTDGSTPTAQSTRYTGTIYLNCGKHVLKAIAIAPGEATSDVSVATYYINVDGHEPGN